MSSNGWPARWPPVTMYAVIENLIHLQEELTEICREEMERDLWGRGQVQGWGADAGAAEWADRSRRDRAVRVCVRSVDSAFRMSRARRVRNRRVRHAARRWFGSSDRFLSSDHGPCRRPRTGQPVWVRKSPAAQ